MYDRASKKGFEGLIMRVVRHDNYLVGLGEFMTSRAISCHTATSASILIRGKFERDDNSEILLCGHCLYKLGKELLSRDVH